MREIDGFVVFLLSLNRDVLELLSLLRCFSVVPEEVLADEADCATEENRCEDDQRQARRHDHAPIRSALVDAQDQAKRNSPADQACVPNEGELFPSDLLRVVFLVTAELEESKETERAEASPNDDHDELD